MRRLMWFTIGFAAACAVGAYLASGVYLALLAVFSFAALLALFSIQSKLSRKARCVLLGCVIGFLWMWGFDYLYLKPVRQMDTQAVPLEITVSNYSHATEYGISAEGSTELNGKRYAVQFYMNDDVSLSPGDRVEGNFTLRYTGGGAEAPTYHKGDGIFLLCYPKGGQNINPQTEVPNRYLPAVLRQKILASLEVFFPEDTAPFVKALLLGDTEDLSYETKYAMKTAGVYHIVAVSGMHVSILFSLVYLLCLKRKWLTAVIGIPVLVLFAVVTGCSPSVVRACIMQILVILALLLNQEYDPPTALSAAVLVILASNPLSITSISLQLSAGCMVGIFLFSQRIHSYLLSNTRLGPAKGKRIKARLSRWIVGSISVTLGAMSTTTPLSAFYFGMVSISGIVTNLLILWVITFVFYGIMAACIFGAIWLPLGKVIGGVISLPIHMIVWVVKMISKIPVSAVYTSSVYIVAWLIFTYVLLAVFLKQHRKKPWVLIGCILVGLIASITLSWIEPRLDDYRITAVDVGQGQCLLLQKDGKHYMVDCGGDSDEKAADEATKLLLSQGIFRLDGLIITHFDADHAGGADALLSRIPAEKLYLPVGTEENDIQNTLISKYSDRISWVEADLALKESNITIYPSIQGEDSNERSLCVLFQPENCDILITGDRSEAGEQELMEHTQLPDLEILVAGHHGSRDSTSWELLNATRPEVVIISVGADNSYGHPTWETLERLRLFGCEIFRTELEGTIIFRG